MSVALGIKRVKELLPNEYLDMLYEIYTPKEVDTILKSYISGRKTTFRINNLKSTDNYVIKELRGCKIKVDPCNIINSVYFLRDINEKVLYNLEVYKLGYLYLQNLSSIIPALILNPKSEDIVLDMCASPGGKSLKLCELMSNSGQILANEINPIRFQRLKHNIEKFGAQNIELLNIDGKRIGNNYFNYFDKVLLDAPCSGEGTIKLKNSKSIKLLKNTPFSKLQKELLVSAFKSLKPGGELVYSTCTISPKENEEVIDYLLKKYTNADVIPIEIDLSNKKNGIVIYKDKIYDKRISKSLRIIPNEIMEGFFICKLRKI